MRLALAGQTYQARTVAASAQSCINVFPERIEDPQETAKGGALLIGAPGKEFFANTASSLRGLWSGGGRVFVAAGTKLYEMDSAGAPVGSVQTIADDGLPVTIFANGNQIMVISAHKCYIWNPPTAATEITSPVITGTGIALGAFIDWVSGDKFDAGLVGTLVQLDDGTNPPITRTVDTVFSPTTMSFTTATGYVVPTTVTWQGNPDFKVTSGAYGDGYFIVGRYLSKQFNISPLFDGTNGGTYVWNGLDFGVKESYPDYIQSILWSNEQLYLFGTDSGEGWQNIGSRLVNGVASFPFQRINGATFKYGSVSPSSPIAIGERVFFLGGDSTGQMCAYVLDGFTPRRISTFAVENSWNNALLGQTAVSASYLEEGHTFWEISFGSGALTWVYDLTTGAWHQRAIWNGSSFVPYGRMFHTFVTNSASAPGNDWGAGGRHLVGGGDGTTYIYTQSLNFYTDSGADMAWQRDTPYIYNGGNRTYYGRMTLDMETGTVASGAEPVITRSYSNDRGKTFVNPQPAGIGVHNAFSRRVYWPPSGSNQDGRVYRFTGVGKSKVALVNCDIELTQGVT